MSANSAAVDIRLSPGMDSDVIRLRELDICAGRLDDIIEPDGEDFALAMIQDLTVEVPRSFAASLWEMVGKRVFVAKLDGQIRAGLMTV